MYLVLFNIRTNKRYESTERCVYKHIKSSVYLTEATRTARALPLILPLPLCTNMEEMGLHFRDISGTQYNMFLNMTGLSEYYWGRYALQLTYHSKVICVLYCSKNSDDNANFAKNITSGHASYEFH